MDEVAIIGRLKQIFAGRDDENLIVGIGDDAAIFQPGSSRVAVATDLLTEGVHFDRRYSDLYSIGRKAAAANLADIFAMGVPARYLLVAVAFDPSDSEAIFDLARGISDECATVGAMVIGGDLSRATSLTVSITAVGEGERAITRSGACEGDGLYLVDLPGRSLLGLEQLRRNVAFDSECIDFHRSPVVDYQSFLQVSKVATALCDISDGILSDARNLARASKVAIDLQRQAILAHPDAARISEVAARLQIDPLTAILTSGEEHGPLFTAKAGSKNEGVWQVGRVFVAEDDRTEVSIDGEPIEATGFQHF